MATIATVKNIKRPKVSSVTDPEKGGETISDADYLEVTLDRFNDGRQVQTIRIYFSDYAGLQTEWEAQLNATVLTAAINAESALVDWPDDELSSAQRAVIGYEITSA